MQPKFTLKKLRLRISLVSALVVSMFLVTGNADAQQYVNGNLSTGPTSSTGTAAPAGYTWSEVQAGNTLAGSAANITAGFSLADDFTVPAGTWAVSKISFFAYSTGYASTTVPPFNDIRLKITNGDPSSGSPTVVYGDLTTNRFSAASNASMYRIFNGTPGTTRIIWKVEVNISGLNLTPGTYWMEWQLGTISGVTSNFSPPSTVVGTVTQPGNNAKQHDLTAGTWANVLDGTNQQDMPFIIDYATSACSGTPAPGNTLPATSNVCPGSNFTLTLQNATAGSGVTYQWQSAPAASGPWTNITGATSASYTAVMAATTYYRCNVTCSGNTGTSAAAVVNLNPPSACYCIPGASDCTDDDVITRVRISTLDNQSTCSAGTPAGYAYYNALPAPVIYSGAGNPITVNVPTTYTEQVAVWIDYNQNGQFEATEFTNIGSNAGNGGVITNNINIPATALTGTTRMRVRVRFSTAWTNTLPCTTVSFGETEDYNVNIQPCVPVTITSNPTSASVVCSGATSFTVATTGSIPAYSWEWRPNSSSAWFIVPNGGIYSGATTSTLTLTGITAAYNGYQYRAVVVGGCSATDVSQAATLTVNPLVPVVNPASATICNGSVQQLSLTNSVSAPVTSTFTSGTVSVSIPESPGGVTSGTSTINVSGIPAGAVITDMKVKLNMNHSWVGDVCYVVKAPNGKVLNLDYFLSQTGGGGTNFVNTVISSSGTAALNTGTSPGFTGTFKPDAGTGSIIPAAVAGPVGYIPDVTTFPALYSTPNGTWTLAFYDYYVDPDPGTFTKWDLEITYVAPILAQGIWTGAAGTMFTDAAATVPYTGTPATTIYVKPTASTSYSVYYTTGTPCTSSTTTVPVSVSNPATGVTVTPTSNPVCVGGTATFTAAATAGNPLAYQWQVSTDGGLTYNNVSGATSSTLAVSNVTSTMSGNRYRVVITSAPCAAVTSTAFGTLTVNPLPVASVTATDLSIIPGQVSTLTASSNPAASSYTWTYNGSPLTSTGNSVTANVDQLGTYTVIAKTASGCSSAAPATITIGAEASDRLWIYPNPNQGAFQVRLYYVGTPSEKRVINIYNSAGQIVASKEFDMTNLTSQYLRMDFDLGPDAKGTYVVKAIDKYTGRIVSGLVVIQ